MARKTRQRISYVLPLANNSAGHRLGVNGLAIDEEHSILYSAGRDGVICAWDVEAAQFSAPSPPVSSSPLQEDEATTFESAGAKRQTRSRQQVQAHTHWINDISLVQSNEALVSASSDISVKLWRPHAEDIVPPQTIGLHNDYVKCVASPSRHADWVAAGGLDRKIFLWDLKGQGERLQIEVPDEDTTVKGSVYALAANQTLVASGGPESVVKVWDARSGKRVTKIVGHTDNIRAILISENNDMIMTASSDRTVKVWSSVAGRGLHTLTMHNDSVWCLLAGDPRLSVFYSGDRSGYVVKTDTRNLDVDDGLSLALCQEHGGINKLTAAGNSIWTATSSSSINRWADVDTSIGVQIPESIRPNRLSNASRQRMPSISGQQQQSPPTANGTTAKIPLNCVLRLPSTAGLVSPRSILHGSRPSVYSVSAMRKGSVNVLESELASFAPLRQSPIEWIGGQNGLTKHVLLNDKRRVLAVDTAGDVMMWDLLHCTPIKSFGKRALESVVSEVNTLDTVANWCTVDTRTGTLTCILEEAHCFDGEIYADELEETKDMEVREDQRINLGKWVLRYLFAVFINEEIRRDEQYRRSLVADRISRRGRGRSKPQFSLSLPHGNLPPLITADTGSSTTLRAPYSSRNPFATPAMGIGIVSPAIGVASPTMISSTSPVSAGGEEFFTAIGASPERASTDEKPVDYFSAKASLTLNPSVPDAGSSNGNEVHSHKPPATPVSTADDKPEPASPAPLEKSPTSKEATSSFGKRLMSTFTSTKKFGRSSTNDPKTSSSDADNKTEESSDSRSSKADDQPIYEDTFKGTLQRIRADYAQRLDSDAMLASPEEQDIDMVETLITPSLPNETPVLKPPSRTTILIQEERSDSAGVADLFEGELGNLGIQADLIENVAPMWLADVLLRNRTPNKEIVKISFVLEPFNDLLPNISSVDDSVERLNANRMLRARKILAYIAERLEAPSESSDDNKLRPEEYLDLYCNNQVVPPKMTLATIRARVWRGGGDIYLQYRANGRKQIRLAPKRPVTAGSGAQAVAGAAP